MLRPPNGTSSALLWTGDHGPIAATQRVHRLSSGGDPGRRIRLDTTSLEQIMPNLLENAVRYSSEGGPIDISAEPQLDEWVAL